MNVFLSMLYGIKYSDILTNIHILIHPIPIIAHIFKLSESSRKYQNLSEIPAMSKARFISWLYLDKKIAPLFVQGTVAISVPLF